MKLLVLSDSHGRVGVLQDIIEKEQYNQVVFLGDGVRDFEYVECDNLIKVLGNCDFFAGNESREVRMTFEGVKTLITHGNLYKVKFGLGGVLKEAKKGCFGLVLFGHTHTQTHEEIDCIHFVNPGSANNGKYAIVEVLNGRVSKVEFKTI